MTGSREVWLVQEKDGQVKRSVARLREWWLGQEKTGWVKSKVDGFR